ncbi:ParB-like partition protein [Streptococcus urinalis FB127-CNA-2]|uniref:ParB-like protein n=1 Tax=Streptococcus urinalis 2285-97 TaxID=764291 RepID=G5KGD8_9STRE|nr:ParB/RepB/Spo0J family partition protein [Streptococcus urinalis]EHJ57230.1 ParB-like protein [Streptococcus urinalis 2285-97]EKS20927.1 ParB-like partition protein [Streptococcus urinalis FB127-CNA-2]VEF33139.1 chromosome partitioning protein [Streptococcus urinalis]
MTETLKTIAIKDIVPNPYQPRQIFNEKELLELSNSIKENGLIQPIIVRKSDVFGYELIAGERRLKASQLAGFSDIPAIIKPISNQESMKQAIIENLQRENLNSIEEALAYQNLIEKNQMTHDELATYMGKSRPYITNIIRLLNLPKELRDSLEKGEISTGHARALLAIEDRKQQAYWHHKIINDSLSVRSLEKALKPGNKKPKQTESIFVKSIEKEISQSLGISSKLICHQKGNGKLTLTFSNMEELNRIINKLK